MVDFRFEWWTVEIRDQLGTCTWEFKGKSKEHVIKQINKEVSDTKSDKNKQREIWCRKPEILEVYWDTLKLDRVGHQR